MAATRLHLVLLLVLVSSATAGRMAYAYWIHSPAESVYSDMAAYYRQALHLSNGSLGPGDTFFPMGYPALIAAADAVSSHPLRLIALVQALAGGLTCLLAYLLARRAALSPPWSLLGAFITALYPPFVFYGSLLLTESVAPFLVMLTVWLMLRAVDSSRWRWAAALGVTFSAASLVRTNFLPFAVVIAVCVWVGLHRQWRLSAAPLAVTAMAALPLLAVASAVNSSLVGRFVGPGTNGGFNFFMMQAEVASARHDGWVVAPVRNVLKYQGRYESDAPFYYEPYFYREGMRLLRADPVRALLRACDGIRESLGVGLQTYWPASQGPRDRRPFPPAFQVMRVALIVSARAFPIVLVLPPLVAIALLVARGTLFGRAQLIWLTVAGVFVMMLVTSLVFLADPRMHVPYDGLLIVASVAAAHWAWSALRGPGRT